MKKIIQLIFSTLLTLTIHDFCFGEVQPDINTILMRSTFKIQGATGSIGTAFIMGKPYDDNSTRGKYVLITADHVLSNIKGDEATIFLRKKVAEHYVKFPYKIKIRQNNQNLWKKHPDVDVAVMNIPLPRNRDLLLASTELLASDEELRKFEIYPGRELVALGYPLRLESNKSGFAVLRSGRIASFPLTPTKELKTFLIDFEVFSGNSGGPVYFHDTDWHKRGSGRIGAPQEVQLIMGIVSKQKIVTEKIESLTAITEQRHQLGLAEIVHASFIKEALELLE